MLDPVGPDNRASIRVPAGNTSAALQKGTRINVVIDSRVAKCLNMSRKLFELCVTTSLHASLDEPQNFVLLKTNGKTFFNNQSPSPEDINPSLGRFLG